MGFKGSWDSLFLVSSCTSKFFSVFFLVYINNFEVSMANIRQLKYDLVCIGLVTWTRNYIFI